MKYGQIMFPAMFILLQYVSTWPIRTSGTAHGLFFYLHRTILRSPHVAPVLAGTWIKLNCDDLFFWNFTTFNWILPNVALWEGSAVFPLQLVFQKGLRTRVLFCLCTFNSAVREFWWIQLSVGLAMCFQIIAWVCHHAAGMTVCEIITRSRLPRPL